MYVLKHAHSRRTLPFPASTQELKAARHFAASQGVGVSMPVQFTDTDPAALYAHGTGTHAAPEPVTSICHGGLASHAPFAASNTATAQSLSASGDAHLTLNAVALLVPYRPKQPPFCSPVAIMFALESQPDDDAEYHRVLGLGAGAAPPGPQLMENDVAPASVTNPPYSTHTDPEPCDCANGVPVQLLDMYTFSVQVLADELASHRMEYDW